MEVHRASGAQRERSASMSAAARAGTPGVEAVPNSGAPLLRDERARREWLEHELDMCCQVWKPRFDPGSKSAAARLSKHAAALCGWRYVAKITPKTAVIPNGRGGVNSKLQRTFNADALYETYSYPVRSCACWRSVSGEHRWLCSVASLRTVGMWRGSMHPGC